MNNNSHLNNNTQPWMMPPEHGPEQYNYMISRPPGSVLPMPPLRDELSMSPPAQALDYDQTKFKGGNRAVIPSKRAAQNRAAQKAFRQRREQYIKDLEIKAKEMEDWQNELDKLRNENGRLLDRISVLEKQVSILTGGDASKIPVVEPVVRVTNESHRELPRSSHAGEHDDTMRRVSDVDDTVHRTSEGNDTIRRASEANSTIPREAEVNETMRRASVANEASRRVSELNDTLQRAREVNDTMRRLSEVSENMHRDSTPSKRIYQEATPSRHPEQELDTNLQIDPTAFSPVPLRAPNQSQFHNHENESIEKRRKIQESPVLDRSQNIGPPQNLGQAMNIGQAPNIGRAQNLGQAMNIGQAPNIGQAQNIGQAPVLPALPPSATDNPMLQYATNEYWNNNMQVPDFDLDFDFDPFFEDEFGPTLASNNDFLPNANSGQVLDDLFAMLQTRQRPPIAPNTATEDDTEVNKNTSSVS